MDGRHYTVLLLLGLPALLIGITVVFFASNPLSIFVLLGFMLLGVFYLSSYTGSFGDRAGSS